MPLSFHRCRQYGRSALSPNDLTNDAVRELTAPFDSFKFLSGSLVEHYPIKCVARLLPVHTNHIGFPSEADIILVAVK